MPTATAVASTRCSGIFCGDRDLLISELTDNEFQIARELAAARKLLHITLAELQEQVRKYDRHLDQHRRLLAEYRILRETILHDDRSHVT